MFQIKSGDEIVEQLFSFKDRGDRDLAIRPEITPTLARMVNQRINTLPRPLKWFSVPRLCRAERPQKGRLREFFQWNIDIIGVEDVLADAEVIFTTVDYLRQVGLTNSDVSVKFSSRKLLAGVLKSIGIAEEQLDALYSLLDKKSRLPPDTFTEALAEKVPAPEMAADIAAFMELDAVSAIKSVVEPNDEINKAVDELAELVHYLDRMGVADYCRFDPSIVRGLAYYTGVVFEVHDIVGQLRAIGGGGRYDNLLKDFGGPDISATGMGMGDCVLEILLRGKQLLDDKTVANPLEYFVAFADKAYRERAVEFTAELRLKGISANFSYKMGGLAKQLKEASERNAQKCIIIGAEIDNNELVVKDMAAGRQQTVPVDKFFAEIQR